MKSKIAIFASGRGSNTRALIKYFKGHPKIVIDCIICNRKDAGVFDVAKAANIQAFYFPKVQFEASKAVLEMLEDRGVDWVILAGFLLKIPASIIGAFQGRMVNIHPSLLPKFGGEGMYGDFVHRAVLESKEDKSGISIHWVDENYDTGSIINQFECEVSKEDDLESLKLKIQKLEHDHYPKIIEELIEKATE
jgi:phosphoribosylglycinamide formyltransferase-1